MRKYYKNDDDLGVRPLEVTIEEVNGDSSKLIKRFMKKVRKEEVLKPFFGKLMYFTTKSQKRRQQKKKGAFLEKRRQQELEE